jgi:hypothetical protein
MVNSNFSNIVIITPINKDQQSKSQKDYNEQVSRGKSGDQIMWDDKKGNPTHNVGGAFGFVHNFNRVEIHMIVAITNPTQRMESWGDNVGQSDRNVLHLSPKLTTISWDTWLTLGCAKKVQGTWQVISAQLSLSNYLDEEVGPCEYVEETGEIIMNR